MNSLELIEKYNNTELLIRGGTFNIWGIPFGKRGDNFYRLNQIIYDESNEILKIITDYVNCIIWKPNNIIENPARNDFWSAELEIKESDRIRLEYNFKGKDYFINFDFKTRKIESNSDFYDGNLIDNKNSALIIGE